MSRGKNECYAMIERVFFLIQQDAIELKRYMEKFEISSRTAKRDIEFVRGRLQIEVDYDRYNQVYIVRHQ